MSKHQVIEGFGVVDVDIGDEPVKHKGKFKRESFPRKYELTPLAADITLAPCEQMYCDEVSGFTCETTDGATSAYIFACGSTGLEFTFLVKAKSDFFMVLCRMCKLADRYHWPIKTLYCDPAAEEWGGKTKTIAEIWNVEIIPQPPNVWQEHSHQESAVKAITQTARYYMHQAPWMGECFWGGALLYATYTRWFMSKENLKGYSSYFAAFKRFPAIRSLKLCPWGCPTQAGRWRPTGKSTVRSYDGYFVHTYEASAMLYKEKTNTVYSVSWKLCFPMGSMFKLPSRIVPDHVLGNGGKTPKFVKHATFVKPVRQGEHMDEVVDQLGMKGGMQKEAPMQFGSCGLPLTDEAVRQWEKAKNEESKDDEISSSSSSSSSSSDDEDETRTRTIKKVKDWDSDDYDDITSEDSESDKEVPVSKKRRIETKAGLPRKAKSDSVYGKVKVQAMNVLGLVHDDLPCKQH